ncbi:hypothetical protein SLE2022_120410 [Rubroshorea leprosula]
MKRPNSLSAFLVFHILIIFLFHSSVANADALQEACKSAASSGTEVTYEFCLQFLGENPQGQSASLENLFTFSLDQLASNATNIVKSVIPKLLSNETLRSAQKCLETTCSDVFKGVPSDLAGARRYFKEKDYRNAIPYVSAVTTDSDTCEDCFRDDLKRESPLAKEDDIFHKMASISLAVVTSLL